METGRTLPQSVRELPIVGGHLALDFANTIDDPEGPARFDHIASYSALLYWCTRVDLLDPAHTEYLAELARTRPRSAAALLRRAQALRHTLNEVFGDAVTGAGPRPESWSQLRAGAAQALAAATLDPADDRYRLRWPTTDLAAPLHPITYAAVQLLTSTELRRLKRCAGCPWLFLDQSKNSSRRWCAMNDCGTHEKIRRYVTRRAARRSAQHDP